MPAPILFPPAPRHLKGRAGELVTLTRLVETTAPARLALVGPGGSGKSILAAALGHRLARRFAGGIHWFRVGAWDFMTLAEMLALRLGSPRARPTLVRELVRALGRGGPRLLVFDNHENDRAMAKLLDALAATPTTIVVTARRCLLSGVLVYPVTAPLSTSAAHAFPRVAALTRRLRWSPLALDLADALVSARATTTAALAAYLDRRGVARVRVIAHEDDLPEVRLLVDWAWARLEADSRRLFGVLAQVAGDHVDLPSLATLARVRARPERALARLQRWRLVQEPMPRRYAVHAVVRHAIAGRVRVDPARLFEHYVSLLEREPERLPWEQTHLFAAMDHAQRTGELAQILRVDRLLERLEGAP